MRRGGEAARRPVTRNYPRRVNGYRAFSSHRSAGANCSCCQRLSPAFLQPATTSLQPATAGSLGMDVASSVAVTLMTTQPEKVPTGIKGPIIIDGQPMGALLLGRSSATMLGLFVLPGVIDADFTGEICVMVYTPFPPIQIEKGQRIAQLVPLEQMTKSLPPLHQYGLNNGL
uniref:dUTPase-like domain-containing protein n=1 Tax=Geospiza parvula TaxID=87175 RepID=A0A8U8B204_GEOPR